MLGLRPVEGEGAAKVSSELSPVARAPITPALNFRNERREGFIPSGAGTSLVILKESGGIGDFLKPYIYMVGRCRN